MYQILIASILFVMIDSLYLTSISDYFNKQMVLVQGSKLTLDIYATVLTYIFLILGLYYFVLREKRSVFDAFMLGLVIYMVYEGTNKAIIKNWSWKTVAMDGLWGGILYASTTYLTYKLYNYLV